MTLTVSGQLDQHIDVERLGGENSWLNGAEEWLWTWVGTGIVGIVALYFTIRTGAVQIRMIPDMLRSVTEKTQRDESAPDRRKSLSSFQAFTVSAAARVGTGNISGVAGAIFLGGPGAVVWMWIMAIFTSAASFTSLQANTIVDAVDGAVAVYTSPEALPWLPVVIRVILAAFTAFIVIGGMRRVATVAQNLVPLMALIYLVLGLIIVLTNAEELPRVISQLFTGAFDFQAVGGGAVGAAIMRGMLSNEAGMGSVPNVAATSSVSHPVKQGLVQTLGVYFDTLFVCSITAFIMLAAFPDASAGGEGLVMVQESLTPSFGALGAVALVTIMFLLAFTSVLGNYSYGEANMNYLTRSRGWLKAFGWAVTLMVLIGSVISVELAWSIAGVSMIVIAAINLVVMTVLGKPALTLFRHYQAERKAGRNPIFLASDLPEIENVECWAEEDVQDYLDAQAK